MYQILHTIWLAISVFISLLLILLYFYLYKWLLELDKQGCDCSDMWQRDFVTYSTVVIIFMSILSMFLNVMMRLEVVDKKNLEEYIKENATVALPLLFMYVLFGFIYIVVLFDFTKRLKDMECKCSESWIREFGYIYSLIMIILWSVMIGLTLLSGIFIAVVVWTTGSGSKQNKSYKK